MQKEFIKTPIDGTVIRLEEINDEVFSKKVLGEGFAIMFTGTELRSPFDGTVIATFPTGHAFLVRRDDGLEVLMHCGLSSAKMPQAFEAQVKKYQKVKAGDVLTKVKPDLFTDEQRICPVVFSKPDLEAIVVKTNVETKALDETAVKVVY